MSEIDKYQLVYSDSLNISGTQEVVQNLELDTVEIGNTGGLTGTVKDQDNLPVEGATVKVFDTNFLPLKHTMTGENGRYNLNNLEPGTYLIHAIKDGYNLSTKLTTTVLKDIVVVNDITITRNETISNGILYGIVYSQNNVRLGDIEVTLSKITNDGEVVVSQTITAKDGEYIIYNIDAGAYKLYAKNDDFFLASKVDVVISHDTNTREILYLTKSQNAKEGTINGVIRDRLTSVPLANACVCLYTLDENEEETLSCMTFSDREGKYFFGFVPEGNYIVKSKVSQ